MDSRTARALDLTVIAHTNDIEELRQVLLIIVRYLADPDRNVIDEARRLMGFLERYTEVPEDD